MGLTDQDRRRLRAHVDNPGQLAPLSSMDRGRFRAVRQAVDLTPEDRELLDTALGHGPRRIAPGGAA